MKTCTYVDIRPEIGKNIPITQTFPAVGTEPTTSDEEGKTTPVFYTTTKFNFKIYKKWRIQKIYGGITSLNG